MPEFIEEETGRRLYHENETTLDIEKEIAKKFVPKKGEVHPVTCIGIWMKKRYTM